MSKPDKATAQKPRLTLTTDDLAEALHYHKQTIRLKVRAGLFDKCKIGSSRPYRFNRAKIEKQLGLEGGALA